MHIFAIAGALIAALVYVPLAWKVWTSRLVQNFATYFLWGLLDLIAAGSSWLAGGNWMLPAMYVACCGAVLLGILRTGTFRWGRVEWFTCLLMLVSLVVWVEVGDRAATVASAVAVALASIPQLVDIWKHPRGAPFFEYLGFTLANGISILGGANWSVEERFYPAICTILTLVFVLVAARQWLPRYRPQVA